MNRDELFDAEGRYRVDSHGAPRGQPDGRDARGVARSGALSHAGRWHRRVRSPGCCLACRQPTLQRSAPWSSSSESWLRQPSPHRGDRPTDDRPPARKAAPSTLVRGVALLVDESYDGRAAPQVGQRRLEHEVVAVHPEHATLLDLAPAAVPRGDDDEPVVLPRGLRHAVPVPALGPIEVVGQGGRRASVGRRDAVLTNVVRDRMLALPDSGASVRLTTPIAAPRADRRSWPGGLGCTRRGAPRLRTRAPRRRRSPGRAA